MPSRGLVAAAALIGVALACLATLRKWERERRLLGRLQREDVLPVDRLNEEERYTAQDLERHGVLRIRNRQVRADPGQLAAFRARHLRMVLSGACVGLILAGVVVMVVLRR